MRSFTEKGDVFEGDTALLWAIETTDGVEETGLSRAVGTDDGGELTTVYRE
jgi:hypothetical protein